ncbi:MAG: hypothetical protein WCQ69_02970 [Bacteroidales bacterium]|jgi:hypothetical protein|nr:hypothetical protein [Bacteroidales bacterium]MDD2264243.1 hypothetical protein [Bacteroidales bacterium]MDD2831477.1 hypothetical protein [Bacteroidales bacterium]MDD3208471.1 hypothetical protein [Bacteroidales bacterium]MDD3697116.1 hypothetical protein [Bacteroidales bacterium]
MKTKHNPFLTLLAVLLSCSLTISCISLDLDAISGSTLVWNSGSNNYFNREAYTTLPGPKRLLIDGEVEKETEIKLSRLPLRTVTVKEAVYCSEGDSIAFKGAFRYDGYALCDILSTLKVDKASKEDFWPPVDIYIEVRNKQGDMAVFSWGEIFYSANMYGIVIAKRVTRVIPGKTGKLWELPSEMKLVVETDLLSERNIKSPTLITVRSLKGHYVVNREPQVLENDPGTIFIQSSLQDTLAVLTNLRDDLPLISHTTLFYGNSMGYKRVRAFKGQQINQVLAPWFPPDDYLAIRRGMLSIAGVDGYRAAFSLSELINRNDHRDPLLVKEDNSFSLYAAGDAFADRCIKGLSEIRLIKPLQQ